MIQLGPSNPEVIEYPRDLAVIHVASWGRWAKLAAAAWSRSLEHRVAVA